MATFVVCCNLKPAKLRGELSEGMVLAAEDDLNVKVLELGKSSVGDEVSFTNLENNFQQISIKDFSSIKMLVKNKEVTFEGKVLGTNKEKIQVEIKDNGLVR